MGQKHSKTSGKWNISLRLQEGPDSTLHSSASRHCKFSDSVLAGGITKGTEFRAVELLLTCACGGGPTGCGGGMEPFALAAPQLLAGQPSPTKKKWHHLSAIKALLFSASDFRRRRSSGEPSVERLRLRRPTAGGGGGGATGANAGGTKGGGPVGTLFGAFGNQR